MYRQQQAIPKNILSNENSLFRSYDAWLMTVILLLIGLGLVMVASSSIAIADELTHGRQDVIESRQGERQ